MTQDQLDQAVTVIADRMIDVQILHMKALQTQGATAKEQMDIMTSVLRELTVHLFSCASTCTEHKKQRLETEVLADMQKYVNIVINL